MDTQTIEILGRNRLVDELLVAGLEVAMPLRDRDIDLIAYVDLAVDALKFAAVPIQMKAASKVRFQLTGSTPKYLISFSYTYGAFAHQRILKALRSLTLKHWLLLRLWNGLKVHGG